MPYKNESTDYKSVRILIKDWEDMRKAADGLGITQAKWMGIAIQRMVKEAEKPME